MHRMGRACKFQRLAGLTVSRALVGPRQVLSKSAILLLCSLLFLSSLSRAQNPSEAQRARCFIRATPPEYPEVARYRHMEGKGKFQGFVDQETGAITKVVVVKSTGHKLLDDAVIGSVRHWRAKPHMLESFYVPVDFKMGDWVGDQLQAARAHTTYAPAPVVPLGLAVYGHHSGGHYQLTVDSKTGRVTDVKVVERSRAITFDQSRLRTFREWRFVPHTVTTLVVPASF